MFDQGTTTPDHPPTAIDHRDVPVVGDRDRPFVLYRALDLRGGLVYVGQTARLTARLAGHRRYSSWWSRVVAISVESFDDRADAMAAELVAIDTESPQENVRSGYVPADHRSVIPTEYALAFDLLLPPDQRTGHRSADLATAVERAVPLLRDLERQLGLMIAALHSSGRSWREIEAETGIPNGTARRWAEVAR